MKSAVGTLNAMILRPIVCLTNLRMGMVMIRRNAYDAINDNNWEKHPVVTLFDMGDACTFDEIMTFAQRCSRMLGFRLRMQFGISTVYFTKAR